MNNFTIVQGLSRTPENIQEQQNVFQGSRTKPVLMQIQGKSFLGAQGRLATLTSA